MLKRSSPRSCKMTFIIGWGFAERQILKKWKWPYLFNCMEYFDKLLREHWYWQELTKEIANRHFLSVEAMPISSFWISENDLISWTVKNIVMKFCIHVDIVMTRCSQWDCQMIFGTGQEFAEVQILKKGRLLQNYIYHQFRLCERQILKKWKWPYLLNWVEYCDRLLRKHLYWQDLAQEITTCHFS